MAKLDTQCQAGNWISMRLVERLGWSAQVSTDCDLPELSDANGRPFRASGVVNITWQRPDGIRNDEFLFYVHPDPGEVFDVIFGQGFTYSRNLFRPNPVAILTLVEHKKPKKGT